MSEKINRIRRSISENEALTPAFCRGSEWVKQALNNFLSDGVSFLKCLSCRSFTNYVVVHWWKWVKDEQQWREKENYFTYRFLLEKAAVDGTMRWIYNVTWYNPPERVMKRNKWKRDCYESISKGDERFKTLVKSCIVNKEYWVWCWVSWRGRSHGGNTFGKSAHFTCPITCLYPR